MTRSPKQLVFKPFFDLIMVGRLEQNETFIDILLVYRFI